MSQSRDENEKEKNKANHESGTSHEDKLNHESEANHEDTINHESKTSSEIVETLEKLILK